MKTDLSWKEIIVRRTSQTNVWWSVCVALQRCQTVCQLCRQGFWLVGAASVCVCECIRSRPCFLHVLKWLSVSGVWWVPDLKVRQAAQFWRKPSITIVQKPNPNVYRSGSFHKQPSQVEGSHNLCVCECALDLTPSHTSLADIWRPGSPPVRACINRFKAKTHIHHFNKNMLLICRNKSLFYSFAHVRMSFLYSYLWEVCIIKLKVVLFTLFSVHLARTI